MSRRFVSLVGVVGFIGMSSVVGCADDPKPSKGSGGTAGTSGSAGTGGSSGSTGKGGSSGSTGKGGSSGSTGKGGSAGSAGTGMSGMGGTGTSGMGGTGVSGMGGTGMSGTGGTMPVGGEGGEAGAEGGAGGESGGEGGTPAAGGMGGEPSVGGEGGEPSVGGEGGEPGMGGESGMGGEPGVGGDTGEGGDPGVGGDPGAGGESAAGGAGGTSTNPPGNLLQGYSFETGLEGWYARGGMVTASTEMPYEGARSLLVADRTEFWMGPSYDLLSVLVPDVAYTVTARVRYVAPVTTPTRINIAREVLGPGCPGDEDGRWQWIAHEDTATDASWVTLSGTLLIESPCAPTALILYVESVSDTASFYVDTVSMVQQ